MRKMFAACVCALALAAPGAALAQDREAITYAYVDGVATATQTDDNGRVTATIACRPPTGDIVISDYTLARSARRATVATVGIGENRVNVPMTLEGRGRNRAVTINLPQRPPILAAVQPNSRVNVTVNGQTHTYLAGSADRMKEIAFQCWGS